MHISHSSNISPNIVCNLEVIFLGSFEKEICIEDLELVYSRSFQMNRQQTYRRSRFDVGRKCGHGKNALQHGTTSWFHKHGVNNPFHEGWRHGRWSLVMQFPNATCIMTQSRYLFSDSIMPHSLVARNLNATHVDRLREPHAPSTARIYRERETKREQSPS
jgi:hypothetical protein